MRADRLLEFPGGFTAHAAVPRPAVSHPAGSGNLLARSGKPAGDGAGTMNGMTAETEPLVRELAARILRDTTDDGEHPTIAPGLALLRASNPRLVNRGVLRPGCCVVAQGQKLVQVGVDTPLRYGAGEFLASSIDMPAVGQVVGATRAKPYLAVWVDLSPHDVLSVIEDAGIDVDDTAPDSPAAYVGRVDPRLLEVVLRAVRSLDDPREARFMAPLFKRELVFRLVTGPSAFVVRQSALLARNDEGIGRAVDWIKTHFRERLVVDALARHAGMSTSSLHHKFKATVMMGPLQYQKRLRLEEARRLLLGGLADATGAAFDVGYESASQFTREYRREFGLPPLQDVRRVRGDARGASSPP